MLYLQAFQRNATDRRKPILITRRTFAVNRNRNMSKLSTLAETMVGSEIVRLGNEINERINKGEEIFNFTIGDFDPAVFPIPKELESEIIESYKHHYTNYPPAKGLEELRLAVLQFLKEWQGMVYNTEEIIIASGGRPLIYALFKTVVDKDDKVIYAVPSWNNNHYTHMNWANHCVIEATAETDFMPTAKDIEKNIEGAALICLCSPQNPTGTTLGMQQLEEICDLVIAENKRRGPDEKKLYVMFDQMYWTLTYGQTRHYNPVFLRKEMCDYTIFIDGISKAFAATGVRVGWAIGPERVVQKMRALLTHIGAWAPMAEQKATAKYLQDSEAVRSFILKFKTALELRLLMIHAGLIKLKEKEYKVDAISPQAAIYLTVKFDLRGKSFNGKKLENQSDVTEFLLSEAGLAIVPFYAFGASKQSPWYRLSVGTCHIEQIEKFLNKLETALEKLQ